MSHVAEAHVACVPTPGERRALLFFAAVAALGVGVRGWMAFHPPEQGAVPGNRAALARQIEAVDSAVAARSSPRKARAARAGANQGSAESPAEPPSRTTRRRPRSAAVADTRPRDPRQSYWDRSLQLDSAHRASEPTDRREAPRRRVERLAGRHPRLSGADAPPVDLDVAGVDEVAAIPLVGPALARRIVADRIENGPFGSIVGLARVSGITSAFARRLASRVTFSGIPRHQNTGETRSRSKSERRPER